MNTIEKKGAYNVSCIFNTCKNKFEFKHVLKSYTIRTCNRITL